MSKQKTPTRVVIDTNIWISALLSKEGTPARLVKYLLSHSIPVFSDVTFSELETRLWKPKFDPYLTIEIRRDVLHDLSATALWINIPKDLSKQSFCRDLDDDKFIHTALAAQAEWLISGDKDLLEAPTLPQLKILSPTVAAKIVAL